ncbi:MAG: hypothetical protein PHV59_02835 [Victivallales bacterium]|nr:hypothetical protein [Victivallales bacterium]
MGIIWRTFTFWLITGILAAVVITVVIPWLKTTGTVKDIPGSDEAAKLVRQAQKAIAELPRNPLKKAVVSEDRQIPSLPITETESLKARDAKLFQRQCSILDDLM